MFLVSVSVACYNALLPSTAVVCSSDVVLEARPGLEATFLWPRPQELWPWPRELHWQFFGITVKLTQDNKLIPRY